MEPTSCAAAPTRRPTLPALRLKRNTAPLRQIQKPRVTVGEPNGPHTDKEVCKDRTGRPGTAKPLKVSHRHPIRIMVDQSGEKRAPDYPQSKNIYSVPCRFIWILYSAHRKDAWNKSEFWKLINWSWILYENILDFTFKPYRPAPNCTSCQAWRW